MAWLVMAEHRFLGWIYAKDAGDDKSRLISCVADAQLYPVRADAETRGDAILAIYPRRDIRRVEVREALPDRIAPAAATATTAPTAHQPVPVQGVLF